MTRPTLLWLRDDLRLADNPALQAAATRGGPVVPVYIQDDAAAGAWPIGAAARWWQGQSLAALDRSLAARGARLITRQGDSLALLRSLIAESGADTVLWNRRYTPAGIAQDTAIKAALKDDGIEARSHQAAVLVEPMQIEAPGLSFSKFFEHWQKLLVPPAPLPAPDQIPGLALASDSLDLLAPDVQLWTGKLAAHWQVGEAAAHTRLGDFIERSVMRYGKGRHQLGQDDVSGLSPHLHAGEISPTAVLRAVPERQGFAFIRQLAWREYATYLLYHQPSLPDCELMPARRTIPWREAPAELHAWQRGETGYALVDAGMRQLWATGWMHNRARMVTASFLTKHLLIDWRLGQRWFWDTLVDADLASNAMGWQWSASVGADAQGFVRIFDPIGQAEKFDPDGAYRQRWLGNAPRPEPIVAHKPARERALSAYSADADSA